MRVVSCSWPPSLVVEWLRRELEERGISGQLYARTLLSLLHSHYCCHTTTTTPTDAVTGGNRHRTTPPPHPAAATTTTQQDTCHNTATSTTQDTHHNADISHNLPSIATSPSPHHADDIGASTNYGDSSFPPAVVDDTKYTSSISLLEHYSSLEYYLQCSCRNQQQQQQQQQQTGVGATITLATNTRTVTAAAAAGSAAKLLNSRLLNNIGLLQGGLLEDEEELILGQSLHPDADLPLVPHPKTPRKNSTDNAQSCCCDAVSRRARKRHKKLQQQFYQDTISPLQLQKLTAVQCLISASEQKRSGLESLVEELCSRLKAACDSEKLDNSNQQELSLPPPPPPPSVATKLTWLQTQQYFNKLSTSEEKDEPNDNCATASNSTDTAKRYFEAFPALPHDTKLSTRDIGQVAATDGARICSSDDTVDTLTDITSKPSLVVDHNHASNTCDASNINPADKPHISGSADKIILNSAAENAETIDSDQFSSLESDNELTPQSPDSSADVLHSSQNSKDSQAINSTVDEATLNKPDSGEFNEDDSKRGYETLPTTLNLLEPIVKILADASVECIPQVASADLSTTDTVTEQLLDSTESIIIQDTGSKDDDLLPFNDTIAERSTVTDTSFLDNIELNLCNSFVDITVKNNHAENTPPQIGERVDNLELQNTSFDSESTSLFCEFQPIFPDSITENLTKGAEECPPPGFPPYSNSNECNNYSQAFHLFTHDPQHDASSSIQYSNMSSFMKPSVLGEPSTIRQETQSPPQHSSNSPEKDASKTLDNLTPDSLFLESLKFLKNNSELKGEAESNQNLVVVHDTNSCATNSFSNFGDVSVNQQPLLKVRRKLRFSSSDDSHINIEEPVVGEARFQERIVLEQVEAELNGRGMERSDKMPSIINSSIASQYQGFNQFVFGDIDVPIQQHLPAMSCNIPDELKLERIVEGHCDRAGGMVNDSIPQASIGTIMAPCRATAVSRNSLASNVNNSLQMLQNSGSERLASALGCDGNGGNNDSTGRQSWQTWSRLEDPFDSYVGDVSSRESSEDREDYDEALADDEDEDGYQTYAAKINRMAEEKKRQLQEKKKLNALKPLTQSNLQQQQEEMFASSDMLQPISSFFSSGDLHATQQRQPVQRLKQQQSYQEYDECHQVQQEKPLQRTPPQILTQQQRENLEQFREQCTREQLLLLKQEHQPADSNLVPACTSNSLKITDPDEIFDKLMYEASMYQQKKPEVMASIPQSYSNFVNAFNQQNLAQSQQQNQQQPANSTSANSINSGLPQEICDRIHEFMAPYPLSPFSRPKLGPANIIYNANNEKSIWADNNDNSLLPGVANIIATAGKPNAPNSKALQNNSCGGDDQHLCKNFQSLGLERIWNSEGTNNNDEYDAARLQMLQGGSLYKHSENLQQQLMQQQQYFAPQNYSNMDTWNLTYLQDSSNLEPQENNFPAKSLVNPVFMRISSGLNENENENLIAGFGDKIDIENAFSGELSQQQQQQQFIESIDENSSTAGGGVASIAGSCADEDLNEQLLYIPASGPCGVQAVLQRSNQSNFSSVVPRRTVEQDNEHLKPSAVSVASNVSTVKDENLLTSPRTHFRPIKLQDESTTTTTAATTLATFTTSHVQLDLPYQRSNSGTLYLDQDVIDGSPKKYMIYKDPTDKSVEHRPLYMPSQESSLVPKFKVVKNEKFCQTDDPNNGFCKNSPATTSCASPPLDSDEDYDVFAFQKHDLAPQQNAKNCWVVDDTRNCQTQDGWNFNNKADYLVPNNTFGWIQEPVKYSLRSNPVPQKNSSDNLDMQNNSQPASSKSSHCRNLLVSMTGSATTTKEKNTISSQDRYIDTPAARAIWSSDPNTSVTATTQLYHQAIISSQHVNPAIKALWANSPVEKRKANIASEVGNATCSEFLPSWTMKRSGIENQIPTEWIAEQSILYDGDKTGNIDRDNFNYEENTLLHETSYNSRDDQWSSGDDYTSNKDEWSRGCANWGHGDENWIKGNEHWSKWDKSFINYGASYSKGAINWNKENNRYERWSRADPLEKSTAMWSAQPAGGDEGKNWDQHLADLALLAEAQKWEKSVSMGVSVCSNEHQYDKEEQKQEDLDVIDPFWALEEDYPWGPARGNTPRKVLLQNVGGCEDELDDNASMCSSSSSDVVVVSNRDGSFAVPVEYLDEELYDQIFGAPDLQMAGSLPDLPNNQAGLKMLRERWLPPWRRPCTFFMEGSCRRKHCKFSHELASITCRFWQEGTCLKGSECPFLHGYPSTPRRRNRSEGDSRNSGGDGVARSLDSGGAHQLRRESGKSRHRLSSFEISSETDFPSLGQTNDAKECERGGVAGQAASAGSSNSQQQQQQQTTVQQQLRKKTKYTPITAAIMQSSGVSNSSSSGGSNSRRRRRHTHSVQRSSRSPDSHPINSTSSITNKNISNSLIITTTDVTLNTNNCKNIAGKTITTNKNSDPSVPSICTSVGGTVATTRAINGASGTRPKPRRNRKSAVGGGDPGCKGDDGGVGGGSGIHKDGTMSDY